MQIADQRAALKLDILRNDCDVLVIGGGFAGLNAAVAAKEAGQNVVLIDKGRPGYSGLTPWASSHRWFDPEMGDDEQAFKDTINRGGDYINNMNWYQCWIDESKETAQRLMDWGILTQYTRASEAGDYYNRQDYAGYREAFAKNDRRKKFIEVLNAKGIEYAENVMITNIVKTGDRVTGGVGFTSSFVSIQGTHAGKAAAAYAATAEPGVISADDLAAITEEINAPLSVAQGFDPNWARDQLSGIMSPYWIHIVKTRETLEGALAQVEYMRDNVVPKLAAATPHDLRLCHEMKHKVLSAEMKLRAGLAREETRGLSYRADFPYRDDENFLCYITVQKGEDGKMVTGKVPVKDEWKGDVTQPYAERYGYYFPGETEAKGIVVEESTGWGK